MKRSLGSRFLFVTVFSLVLSLATGTVAAQTANLLYSFSGQDDGGHPQAVLIMDSSGNQYGTTSKGGTYNHGTVFELASSSGSYSEKVLYSFTNSNGDGAQPQAGLITDSSGNLYGTTYFGGAGCADAISSTFTFLQMMYKNMLVTTPAQSRHEK